MSGSREEQAKESTDLIDDVGERVHERVNQMLNDIFGPIATSEDAQAVLDSLRAFQQVLSLHVGIAEELILEMVKDNRPSIEPLLDKERENARKIGRAKRREESEQKKEEIKGPISSYEVN